MVPIPSPSGQLRADIVQMPYDADAQVEFTVQKMREYALADARSPEIKRDVQAAAAAYDSPLYYCLWRWVKDRMRFTTDHDLASLAGLPADDVVEILVRPIDISRQHAFTDESGKVRGDCDDYTMYLACLLTAAGIPCTFTAVAADPHVANEYSHIYVCAYPRGEAIRLPLDASHGVQPGWETENRLGKRKEWPVSEGGYWA